MEFSISQQRDNLAITQLFTNAFSDSEGSTEGKVIGNLTNELITTTQADALFVFTATENNKMIGCIIFSKLTFDQHSINAFILSPAAVDTVYQGKGIGQKLINFSLNYLQQRGIELVVTYGDPNFYTKVGFQPIPETLIKSPLPLSYPKGWLAQSLLGNEVTLIKGNSTCVAALNNPDYW